MDMPVLHCKSCQKNYLPPKSFCPRCFSECLENAQIKGTGKIYSYTTIHVPPEKLAEQAPYHVVLVELDDGTRVTGRLVEGEPVIQRKVAFAFIKDGVYWFQ